MATKRCLDEGSKITVCNKEIQQCIINAFVSFRKEAKEDNVCVTKTDLIRRVARMLILSQRTVQTYILKWERNEVMVTPGKERKKSKPITGIDGFAREAIGRIVYQHLGKGQHVTVRKLHAEIRNDDTIGFRGSETSLKRVLKDLGFKWGKGDGYAHLRETDDIVAKRHIFLREYLKNKRSTSPKLVIFLDETWIFVNGKRNTWMDPSTSKGILRRPEEGGRIVTLHAGSINGFIPGVGLIFHTLLKSGQDYHGAMNGEKFENWVKETFIPAIRNMGQCLIVMDNASYHSRLLDPSPTSKCRKSELHDWLNKKHIHFDRDASVSELRVICKQNSEKMKRYVVDEMLEKEGHEVLRTPPYHCIFNAIEHVWSDAKRFYDKNVVSREGRGFERSKLVWEEALNQVTTEKWANYVKHAETTIEKAYDEEVISTQEWEEIIINLEDDSERDGDEESDGECEEMLAEPLPIPGPSGV